MAFVPFTEAEQPTMAAFNEKFQSAIDDAVARGIKMEFGSYVGTGLYGPGNPNSITVGFKPKFLSVSAKDHGRTGASGIGIFVIGSSYGLYLPDESGGTELRVSTSGNTVSWYNWLNNGATVQLNDSGREYIYVIFGEGGDT